MILVIPISPAAGLRYRTWQMTVCDQVRPCGSSIIVCEPTLSWRYEAIAKLC